MKLYKLKKFVNRLISSAVAAAVAMPIVAAPEMFEYIPHFPHISVPSFHIFAAEEPEDVNGSTVTFLNWGEFADFARTYENYPAKYQTATLKFSFTGSGNVQTDSSSYLNNIPSLGGSGCPFNGTIILDNNSVGMFEISAPLFKEVNDSIQITNPSGNPVTIIIGKKAGDSTTPTPLFAEKVCHDENNAASQKWSIETRVATDNNNQPDPQPFAGIIGTVDDEALVDITVKYSVVKPNGDIVENGIQSNDDIGLICGRMGERSVVSVSLIGDQFASVKSNNGSAGGLVGKMETGSSLTVSGSGKISSVVGKTYAGGIVGYAENATISVDQDLSFENISVSSGANKASGGFAGYYKNTLGSQTKPFTVDVSNFNSISCDLSGTNNGGLIGELENKGYMVIDGHGAVVTSTTGACSEYGGIIGVYSADSLEKELIIRNIQAVASASGKVNNYYGGIVGKVKNDTSAAYVNISNVEVSASGISGTFGGVVGCGSTGISNGCFLNIGSAKVSTDDTAFTGGGLVGVMEAGVIRLGGLSDTTAAKPDHSKGNTGHILGKRGRTLVYAVGTGNDGDTPLDSQWTIKRYYEYVDDVGTWGEVLRPKVGMALSSIFDEDSTTHSVKIKPANTIMADTKDFIITALNIQLNSGSNTGALCFEDTSNNCTTLLNNKGLELTGNVDLSGTGITGMMRDDGFHADNANKTAVFTGKLNGNNHTVTLAVGEEYGPTIVESDGTIRIGRARRGRIYRHRYSGLLARTGDNAKVEKLTIGGFIDSNPQEEYTYIGGIVAYHLSGTLIIDHVRATVEAADEPEKLTYMGGIVGCVNSTVKITYCDGICPTISSKAQMAGSVAGFVNSGSTFTLDNVKIGGTASVKTGGNASIGGVLGQSDGAEINLYDVDFEGFTLGLTNGGTGGIIGQQLNETTVNFGNGSDKNGVTIKALSKVVDSKTVSEPTHIILNGGDCGGLACKASGHWLVKKKGVNIENLSVDNGNGAAATVSTFGLMVGNGRCSADSCLYLELDDVDSYKINSNYIDETSDDVSIKLNTKYFDELIGRCGKDTANTTSNDDMVYDNGQPIISIRTSDNSVSMNGTNCNTYQNRTKNAVDDSNWAMNRRIRYYYNLDCYDKAHDDIGSAEELLMWSVYTYASTNIKSYFGEETVNNCIDGSDFFDMLGLSYYPVNISDLEIKNGNFIFYNNEFNTSESQTGNSDRLARNTSAAGTGKRSQHYLLHGGLFRNVTGTLTVSGNISFDGNVGMVLNDKDSPGLDGSGVMVCGTFIGTNNNNNITDAKLNVTGSILLDGIKINGHSNSGNGSYSPLLINKVRSYSNLSVNNISNSNKYTVNGSTAMVASSLIGEVGSKDDRNIVLSFSNIVLDSRKSHSDCPSTELDNAYNTQNAIFKRATLLEKFVYGDENSYAVYNYTHADDWESPLHQVTYGKEIISSNEFNKSQENYQWFYSKSNKYTDPINNNANAKYTNFSNFLQYVATGYNESNKTHEIMVNHTSENITRGCGTYNDPYVIKTPGELLTVDKILNGLPPAPNTEINYPKDSTRSNKWCNGKTEHETLTYNNEFFLKGSNKVVSLENMRKYLAQAYYYIDPEFNENDKYEITTYNSFTGFGGKEQEFTGYIIGNSEKMPTITMSNPTPLVRNSRGCVIKDLNIKLEADFLDNSNVDVSKTFTYADDCNYYGAVIGQIFGGDNVIDNVKVDYNVHTLSSSNRLVPIGGYVGVIVDGGLYFRNMINSSTHTVYHGYTNDATFAADDYSRLYNNPYIGRVINGFAVYEDDGKTFGTQITLDNNSALDVGTKNYVITDMGAPESSKLSLSSGSISIPNGQALFALAAIIQSGAGTSNNYGNSLNRTHRAFYNGVGTVTDSSDADFVNSKSDTTSGIPHIIDKYTASSELKNINDKKVNVTLNGSGYDMTKTGYRGLNGLFNQRDGESSNTAINVMINNLDGNDNTVYLNMCIRCYGGHTTSDSACNKLDNYPLGENQSKKQDGFGFINYTYAQASGGIYQNINISGNIKAYQYEVGEEKYIREDDPKGDNAEHVCWSYLGNGVGGLIGAFDTANDFKFENVQLNDLYLVGNKNVAGIIGYFGRQTSAKKLTIKECLSTGNNGFSLEAGENGGGLLAETSAELEVDGNNGNFKINHYVFHNTATAYRTRGAGLVGRIAGKATIKNYKVSGVGDKIIEIPDVEETHTSGNYINNRYLGVIVGREDHSGKTSEIFNIEISDINLKAQIGGGIVGQSFKSGGTNIHDCKINNLSVYSLLSAGGIIGDQGTYSGSADINIELSDLEIKNSEFRMLSNQDTHAGCVIGSSTMGGTIKMKNIVVSDNKFIFDNSTNKNRNIGGLIGYAKNPNKSIKGYNILVKGNSYSVSGSGGTVSIGELIGRGTTPLIILVPIKIVPGTYTIDGTAQDSLTEYGFSELNTASYLIFADFDGLSLAADHNEVISSFNAGTHVELKKPFLAVNPKSQITTDQFLTGDGASSAVITKIKDDTSIYSRATTERAEFKSGRFKDKITTFKSIMGDKYTGTDFPVIVVDTTLYDVSTDEINHFIHMLTNENGNTMSADNSKENLRNYAKSFDNLYKVSVTQYRYNNGRFITAGTEPTLGIKTNTNQFHMVNKDKSDLDNVQFNLIDVQYKNPLDKSQIAYHLYIPVVVVKALKFDFSAKLLSDTDYKIQDYADANSVVIAPLGQALTSYVTYTYKRTAEEWQDSINQGDKLLIGIEKAVKLDSTNNDANKTILPSDTKFVIVDVNNKGKAYYADGLDILDSDGMTILFKNFQPADGSTGVFSFTTLNDLLEKESVGSFTVSAYTSGPNKYTRVSDTTQADIRVGNEYFRYVQSDDTSVSSADCVSITYTAVDEENFTVSESYFISFYTQKDDSNINIYNNIIMSAPTLNGTSTLVSNNSGVRMIVGNFYQQEVELHTTSADFSSLANEVIGENNSSVYAAITSNIVIANENKEYFSSYLNDDDIKLYHEFLIYLTGYRDNTVYNRHILGSPTVNMTYSIYDLISNNSLKSETDEYEISTADSFVPITIKVNVKDYLLVKNNSSYDVNNIRIESNVSLTYSDQESRAAQFPSRSPESEGANRNYVKVSAYSNLAYTLDSLHTSCISQQANYTDGDQYYMTDVSMAKVTYNVPPINIDDPDGSFSQLGINPHGNDVDPSPIYAKGNYCFADVADQETANKIKLTLKLYKKKDDPNPNANGPTYVLVDPETYLDSITLNKVVEGQTPLPIDYQKVTVDKGTSQETYIVFTLDRSAPAEDKGNLDFETYFNVKFSKEYANYRVEITGELYNNNTFLDYSDDYDHIVYTYAKIATRTLDDSNSNSSSSGS